jgi:DNA-binding Lrp family transcriptional regulator
VFFEFKTNPYEPWLAEFLEKMKECDMLNGITGEYSLLGRFRILDEEHFGRILRRIDEVMTKSFFKKYRVVNVISTSKESGVPFERKAIHLSSDDIDLMILRMLLNQPRYIQTPQPLSATQISRLLGDLGVKISQPSVFKRLKRLEDQGVILRYTILVNQEKMGFKTQLVVRIKVNPASYDNVARDFLVPVDAITDLYRTGEDYGLLAIIRVRDASEYNAFLLGLYASKDIIDTYTTLILEERKKHPSYL